VDRPATIDPDWLADHPLPDHAASADKDDRGHVLVIGGSRRVPGGLLLTGESALRAGAGRLQLATVEGLAIGLGLAIPEAGVLPLAEGLDGEIRWAATEAIAESLDRSDCIVVGPAMSDAAAADPVVAAVFDALRDELSVVLDAAAIGSATRVSELADRMGRVVLTPNRREMARLLQIEMADIADDPEGAARRAVERTGATVIFKGPRSVVATPQGELLAYPGGGIGLATGGSGDVLAGILGGLLGRGTAVATACAWAVWLHGEAGRLLARERGPIGYLARELPPLIPALMRAT
jgi:ADP-dependent NAD(P)H-hydrate dehydratase